MPSTSLVKFMGKTNGGKRGQLYWGRADMDGAPYRGPTPPMLPSEELEDRLTRVCDPHVRIFDLSRPEDNTAYVDVTDKITNKWAHCLFVKRIITRNKKTDEIRVRVYLEWVEFYMEDGQPMHSQRPYIGKQND